MVKFLQMKWHAKLKAGGDEKEVLPLVFLTKSCGHPGITSSSLTPSSGISPFRLMMSCKRIVLSRKEKQMKKERAKNFEKREKKKHTMRFFPHFDLLKREKRVKKKNNTLQKKTNVVNQWRKKADQGSVVPVWVSSSVPDWGTDDLGSAYPVKSFLLGQWIMSK